MKRKTLNILSVLGIAGILAANHLYIENGKPYNPDIVAVMDSHEATWGSYQRLEVTGLTLPQLRADALMEQTYHDQRQALSESVDKARAVAFKMGPVMALFGFACVGIVRLAEGKRAAPLKIVTAPAGAGCALAVALLATHSFYPGFLIPRTDDLDRASTFIGESRHTPELIKRSAAMQGSSVSYILQNNGTDIEALEQVVALHRQRGANR